jgi:peptidoglycan/xylan/chitin deacetylase (PgdA/CDA1 family)
MIKPIKGTFKTFHNYIKIIGHNDKELDPKQFTKIDTEEKVLYLTFDTCPTNVVDFDMVDWLLSNKIPATIFLNIEWYKKNKSKGLDFLKSPQFTIGGHGYNHERPANQDFREQTYDIDSCVNFIQNELNRDVKWYRSPYGKPNEDTINILDGLGIRYASWAGHVFDKSVPDLENPNKVALAYLAQNTLPGDILLFHINGEGINSLEILKIAYTWATDKGYSFKKL